MLRIDPQRIDHDFDEHARRLRRDLGVLEGLCRYCLLCRLTHGGYQQLGSRRLHAVADALTEDSDRDDTSIDLLRFLAEIAAIEKLGAKAAAEATDPRTRSETARHFGKPVSVLWRAVCACMRQERW